MQLGRCGRVGLDRRGRADAICGQLVVGKLRTARPAALWHETLRYVVRRDTVSPQSVQQSKWTGELSPSEWRDILLQCCSKQAADAEGPDVSDIAQQLEEEANASFSDGINTGFYINAYTTKQCPTMDGVLEEMGRGLERLRQAREAEQERIKEELEKQGPDAEKQLTIAERRALKGRSPFGQTMDVLKRLSASYRRCYWKSCAEMFMPILFGHMTFASHRCWTVFIKKAVFLAAQAWRGEYGKAVRHAAIKDGGGEVVQYIRAGMDPWPMVGWRRVELEEGGVVLFQGPNGEVYDDLQQAYEYEVAAKAAQTGMPENRLALTFLQKFLNECGSEHREVEEQEERFVVTTSTLEDWLYRGDHPVVVSMSYQVYAMWVYRVERPPIRPNQKKRPRYIDMDFAPEYALYTTHFQRIAWEYRVPLFEGFTMPSYNVDSETAAMYKQLLLRPTAVAAGDEPEDVRGRGVVGCRGLGLSGGLVIMDLVYHGCLWLLRGA